MKKLVAILTLILVIFLFSSWAYPQVSEGRIHLVGQLFEANLAENTPNPIHWLGWDPGGLYDVRHMGSFPDRPLSKGNMAYFEHLMSGRFRDEYRAEFAPHQMPCHLGDIGQSSASLSWKSDEGPWPVDVKEEFWLDSHGINMRFELVSRSKEFANGDLSTMHANYMWGANSREIYFFGYDRPKKTFGWKSFGEVTTYPPVISPITGEILGTWSSIEWGAQHVACWGEAPLLVENQPDGTPLKTGHNLAENPDKFFVLPVYFGLYDGDDDFSTTEDKMAFVIMFSKPRRVQFTLYNWGSFINQKTYTFGEKVYYTNTYYPEGTHVPAWDWRGVFRNPVANKSYGYQMRIVCLPATDGGGEATRKAVIEEYIKFLDDIGVKCPIFQNTVRQVSRNSCKDNWLTRLMMKYVIDRVGGD